MHVTSQTHGHREVSWKWGKQVINMQHQWTYSFLEYLFMGRGSSFNTCSYY
jgi:hypothetical protein